MVETTTRGKVEVHADARSEPTVAARSASVAAPPLRPAKVGDRPAVHVSSAATATPSRPEEDTGERRVAAVTTPTTAAPRASSQPIDPAPSTLVHADRDIHSSRVSSPATSTVTSGGEAVSTRREVASSSAQVTPRSAPISAPAVAADPASAAPRSAEPQFLATKTTQRPTESSSIARRTHDDARIERSIVKSAPSAVDHAPPSDAPAHAVSPVPVRHDVVETAPLVAPKTSYRTETSDTHAPTAPAVDSAKPVDAPTPSSHPSSIPPIVTKRMDAAPIVAASASHPARSSDDRAIAVANPQLVAPKTAHREETSETHAPSAQSVVAAKPEHAPTPSTRPSFVPPIVAKSMDAAPIAATSASDAARSSNDRAFAIEATNADTAPVRSTETPSAPSPVATTHDAPRATPRDAASPVTPPNVITPATSPARALDASDSALLSTIDAFAAARAAQTSRGDRKTVGQKSEPTAEITNVRPESDEGATFSSAPLERAVAPILPVADTKRAGDPPAHPSTIAAAIRDAATPAAAAVADADVELVSKEEEAAAPTIGRIDLSTPSANPAQAMAALLAPQARALIATGRAAGAAASGASATRPAAEAAQRAASLAAKTLTIELAPESLGAVVVKMKIAHSGVEMKISVRSEEALHKLEATRNALVDAMQSAGCSIDGCTIQIASAPTPDAQRAATEGGGFFASSNGAETQRGERNVGGEGASDGQGSGGRRRDTGARDDGAPDTAPRRPADRRGGGVYL